MLLGRVQDTRHLGVAQSIPPHSRPCAAQGDGGPPTAISDREFTCGWRKQKSKTLHRWVNGSHHTACRLPTSGFLVQERKKLVAPLF